MVSREIIAEAVDSAEQILKHKQRSDPARWIQKKVIALDEYSVFWWSDTIPLIEIPLLDCLKAAPDGYFLVSGDKRLPPLLEHAPSGPPLSHQVKSVCMPALHHAQIDLQPAKFHYASSTDMFLEFPPVDGVTHLLDVSNFVVSRFRDRVTVERRPEDSFNQDIVANMWRQYTPGGPGDVPAIVLPFLTPVKYTQTCDAYGTGELACKIKISSSENYCTPHAISGCIPVAWAMLMSSWKRSGFFGANQIWANSTCWALDWHSWGGSANPSQCKVVEDTIWKLHSIMSTTHDGSTTATSLGAAIFGDYGLNWAYREALNQPYEFAISITQAGQPLLWTAQGNWNPGELAGHGIISYGYQKSDRSLFICLGWGAEYPDKFIYYDQYSQNGCYFMTSHATAAAADGKVLSII
jgi:hypothetical protein